MQIKNKFTAGLAAATLMCATGAAGLPVAFAAPGGPVGAEATPGAAAPGDAALVNPRAEVALNITKYDGDPGNTTTPLNGVTFTVEKIADVDLTTNAGWARLAEYTNDPALLARATTNFSADLVTGNGGTASISTGSTAGFTVGAYRVTEKQFGSYSVAAPFVVALPHTNADGQWVYTQDVFPKNQNVKPNKQVDDTNATIGSTLAYTINAPVPAGEPDPVHGY